MTTGLHTANLANRWLDMLGATAFTAPTNVYVKLHTGDPGAAGTANASAETTRKQITWSAAASGSKSMSGTLSWTSWAAGTETISHISIWDNSTAGNVLWSGQLSSNKTVNNGDTLNITSLTAALTPLMA
jgi:hypothetical protein